MESIIKKERQKHLQDDQASGRKRKMTCLSIFFMVLFTVIIVSIISVFVVIKQEAESESLSASSPEEKIKVICDLTQFPTSCFDPILSLRRNMTNNNSGKVIKTTPSTIFMFSLRAAFNELNSVSSSSEMAISKVKNSTILSALQACDDLVRDSSILVNLSMATWMRVSRDDEMLRIATVRSNLEEWITSAVAKIDRCLSELEDGFEGLSMKMKMYEAKKYVVNCSVILTKMDRIIGMFNPPLFQSITDSRSFLLSTLDHGDYSLILFYCLQYFFLVVFLCIVLKL